MLASLLAVSLLIPSTSGASPCPESFEEEFLAGSLIGGQGGECGMSSVNPKITQLGDSILPCLDRIVRDGGASVGISACRGFDEQQCRAWAVAHIGRIDTRWARALLLMYAVDDSSPVQYYAISGLYDDAGRAVLRATAARPGRLSSQALVALGRTGNQNDVDLMLEATSRLPPSKRREAAYAFSLMGETAPLPKLSKILGDGDPIVTRWLEEARMHGQRKALYRLGSAALENGDLQLADALLSQAGSENRAISPDETSRARAALARVHHLAGDRASAGAIWSRILAERKNRIMDPRLLVEAEIGLLVVERWTPGPDARPKEWMRVATMLWARPPEEQRALLRRYPEFLGRGQAVHIEDPALSRQRDALVSSFAQLTTRAAD